MHCETLEQPPYNPDLSAYDTVWKRFENDRSFENYVRNFFMYQPQNFEVPKCKENVYSLKETILKNVKTFVCNFLSEINLYRQSPVYMSYKLPFIFLCYVYYTRDILLRFHSSVKTILS